MLVFNTCKKIILPIWKLHWIIAIVAIVFGIYPKVVDGIKLNIYFNDIFYYCIRGIWGSSVDCHLRGKKHTFELTQRGGSVSVTHNFIQLSAEDNYPLHITVKTAKCDEEFIELGRSSVIYNATFPVCSDGCNSEDVVLPIVVDDVDDYGQWIAYCKIVNLKSKPELSGELFPRNWEGEAQFLVNSGSVITFFCGENEKQSSTCKEEGKRREYNMIPPIPDNCTTPAKGSKTPAQCSPASGTKSMTSGSKSIMISKTAMFIMLCYLFSSLLS